MNNFDAVMKGEEERKKIFKSEIGKEGKDLRKVFLISHDFMNRGYGEFQCGICKRRLQ